MPKSLPTGTKYQLLLSTARNRSCYNPKCSESLLVERSGRIVANFDFAHIRDEHPPRRSDDDRGWRYWPDDLTIEERNHFSNIILVCKPCHKLIDHIDPRSYSTALLHKWKSDVEGSEERELAGSVGSMTTGELEELILQAVRNLAPIRDVRVSLGLSITDGLAGFRMPLEGARDVLERNVHLQDLETAVTVEATNHGELPVSIASFGLELRMPGRDVHPILKDPDPLGVHPRLPVGLGVGAAQPWLFFTDQLRATVREYGRNAIFTDIAGVVVLATGESLRSEPQGAELIPMWDDPAAIADLLRRIRAADPG